MLQDKYQAAYDFSEVHKITVDAAPQKVFPFVDNFDMSESVIVRTLLKLRNLFNRSHEAEIPLKDYFTELERIDNREIILGLVGQFWKTNGNLQKVDKPGFIAFSKEGYLKATWNFALTAQNDSQTIVETETRVKCLGRKAHFRFSMYWLFVRPFSGLMRKEMLKMIKAKAERRE
jgi:hypothetical protein